jgi:predicted transcriptional regulator of viral defense system
LSLVAGISSEGRSELSAVIGPGRRLITTDTAQQVLGLSRSETSERLSRWADNGWLRRVQRDLYIPVPAEVADPQRWTADALFVADAVWTPCYFSGWTSANHWALTEQVFRSTVVLTSGRVRKREQRLLTHDYMVLHVADESLKWGMRVEWRDGRRLQIADPARTVVDMLANPTIGGGMRHVAEVLTSYLDENEPELLADYAMRLANGAVFKRLGFVTSIVRPDLGSLLAICEEHVSRGFSLLDPSASATGKRSTLWQLRINVQLAAVDAS